MMAKVIYKREIGVNMLGELEYTVLPTCPVCGEVTYKGEDLKILIKNATKKGYLIADDGDGIDTAYLKTSTKLNK